MAIRLKIASNAKELNEVFKLRYDVYVREKGRFLSENETADQYIVDRFDAVPDVANIIAYENDVAIACLRVNKDSAIGLPAEIHCDFSRAREKIEQALVNNQAQEPIIVCGGMLAIHRQWRNRRNVIYALFRMGFGIMHCWGARYVFASISEESLSLYGRIGFKPIAKAAWVESISDSLIPMVASFDKVFHWAFGSAESVIGPFWSNNYCGSYERLLLSSGEVVFFQNESADFAYSIADGWISISQSDNNNNEMVLSNLSKGELFGELAILDNEPRSATATAITNVELVVIHRDNLLNMVKQNPEQLGHILRHFSKRIREIDDFAMVSTYAPQSARIHFALKKLWEASIQDKKHPDIRTVKVGAGQISRSAHAQKEEVRRILEEEKAKGNLEFGKSVLRFFNKPSGYEQFEEEDK